MRKLFRSTSWITGGEEVQDDVTCDSAYPGEGERELGQNLTVHNRQQLPVSRVNTSLILYTALYTVHSPGC